MHPLLPEDATRHLRQGAAEVLVGRDRLTEMVRRVRGAVGEREG